MQNWRKLQAVQKVEHNGLLGQFRKDTHKKSFFLVIGLLRGGEGRPYELLKKNNVLRSKKKYQLIMKHKKN